MNISEIRETMLNEAYLGKAPVKEIETIISRIVNKVIAEPNINLYKEPEAKELEAAIVKVFGFKSARVYWSNQAKLGGMGPYTRPGAQILHTGSESLQYGRHKDGFYDKKHELKLYVQMDQNLVTDCGMTAAEITAILLHEIGHNFDYSPANIIHMYFDFMTNLMSGTKNVTMLLQYAGKTLVNEYGRDAIMFISNMNDYIEKHIPPIGTIFRTIGKVGFNISKIITSLFSPVSVLITTPAFFMIMPFRYLTNYFARKKEVYSDSFAASYGYGAELATGLDKIDKFLTTNNTDFGIMNFFYDINLLQREIVTFATGGHRTTQQRLINAIDKLEKDLASGNYDPKLKADLEKSLADCKAMYSALINMPEEDRFKFTAWFRGMVDNWYAGKPYMIVSPTADQYAE